jgi:hypothetical protein
MITTHSFLICPDENKRTFSAEKLAEGGKIIGLQYGSNKGATQHGMVFGNSRKILPNGEPEFFSPLFYAILVSVYFRFWDS